QVLYFSSNPNGEAEVVTILLRQLSNIKKLKFDLDFAELLIKGRVSKGNTVTKYPIKKIELKEKGISTLRPRKVWFDDTVHRLNVDGRGELLGEFKPEDRLLIITQSGTAKTIIPELTTHFDDDVIVLEQWIPNKLIADIYVHPEKDEYFVEHFRIESITKEESFISEHPHSKLDIVSTDYRPVAEILFSKHKGIEKEPLTLNFEEFISVKGIKAQGNQLTSDKIKMINLLESLPYEEEIQETEEVQDFIDTVDESSLTIEEDGQIGF